MKYTKEDIYEGMVVKWGEVKYKITEFYSSKENVRLIGITNKYDNPYSLSMLITALNDQDCREDGEKPEIQYEIY